jgi:hypothetical protein
VIPNRANPSLPAQLVVEGYQAAPDQVPDKNGLVSLARLIAGRLS